MKRQFLLIAIFAIGLFACNKSDTTTPDNSLTTTPETKAQYNNTSFGVYKGVVIGSTGTIIFRINNGDNVVKGFLTIDDIKDTLSTTQTVTAGQALSNVNFAGRISSMTISANANGNNASLTNIRINGHSNVTGFIVHENSTKQVYCYEGALSGNRTGTFNCTRVGANNGDTAYVLAKVINDSTIYRGFGQVNNNSTTFNLYPSQASTCVIQGNFSGNAFTGSWTWTNTYGSGTFACTRTY